MKNKSIWLIFISIISIFLLGCAQTATVGTGTQSTTQQATAEKGNAVFAITDAAASMQSVSSVKITIDSVKIRSAAESWITVSSSAKTYDLLQLKAEGSQALLADVQLKEGTYDQIRLGISSVVVTDAKGEQEAKLPSGELKIQGNLIIKANSTATATFDFIADESLHLTGNGKYIMAPVVHIETREDADVEVSSSNKVEIKGGKIHTNVRVGMDAEGNIGVGLRIPADLNITIDTEGAIKIGGKGSGKVGIGIGASAE